MKSVLKRSQRPVSFRPRVEMLECRTQPGSVLTGGASLSLLGSTLDLNSLGLGSGQSRDTYAVVHRHLKLEDALTGPASALQGGQTGTVSAAKITLTPAPATTPANGSAGASVPAALPAVSGTTGHAAVGRSAVAPVHSAPVSAASVAAPVQGGTGAGQQVHAVQATPQVAHPVAHPAGESQVTSGAGAHITTVHIDGREGHHPRAVLNWATYLSQAGASLSRDVLGADGNLYVVGTIPDAGNGGSDILVAQVAPDGSSATITTVSIAGSTVNTGNAIAVDTSGSDIITYLGGTTEAAGQSTYLVARYDFTAQAVNWTVRPNNATRGGSVNGLVLDGTGQNLFVTGWEDGTFAGFPRQSILLVQFTDLANSTPTVVHGFIVMWTGFDNDPGTAVAYAVNSIVYVSENFYDRTDTTSNPGVVAYDLTGALFVAAIFETDSNGKSIIGSMNDVIGNSVGQAYSVGTITDATTGNTDVLVATANFAAGMASCVILSGDSNLTANGMSFTGSSATMFPVVVGTDDSNGSVHMSVLHFTPDLLTITDRFEIGGSNTDVATGVATDSSNNAYVVGTTNSGDFPVTDNSSYGGDPSDGVIFGVAVS